MSNRAPNTLTSLEEYQKFRKFELIRIFLYLLIVPIFILVIFFLRRSQNNDTAIRKIKKRTTFLIGVLPVLLLFLFVFIYHLISRRVGKVLHDRKIDIRDNTFSKIHSMKEFFYFDFIVSSLFFNIFIGLFCTYIIVTFYFLNKYPMETIEFHESVTLEQKEEYYKKFGTNFQLNYYFTFIVVLLFLPSLLRICLRKTQEGVKIKKLEKILEGIIKFIENKMEKYKNQI